MIMKSKLNSNFEYNDRKNKKTPIEVQAEYPRAKLGVQTELTFE